MPAEREPELTLEMIHLFMRQQENCFVRFYRNVGWRGVVKAAVLLLVMVIFGVLSTPLGSSSLLITLCCVLGGGILGACVGRLLAHIGQQGAVVFNLLSAAVLCSLLGREFVPRAKIGVYDLGIAVLLALLTATYFFFMSDRTILIVRPRKVAWYDMGRGGYVGTDKDERSGSA